MNKLCECGCGKEVTNEKNRFIQHHQGIGKKLSIDHKIKLSKTKLKMSQNNKGMLGKHHSIETKLKMSKSLTGKKRSIETKLKMSKSIKGHPVSSKTKLKISISTIKYMEKTKFNGKIIRPCVGKNEIPILNKIEDSAGIQFLRNDHDLALKIGKFCDGYNPQFNLPVEVLESFHFQSNGELSKKDQNREILIASRLACMIYYIPEKEFLNNPEKEIQRFKDFLELLKN